MSDAPAVEQAVLEVIAPDSTSRSVSVTETPTMGLRALMAPARAIKCSGGKIVLFGPNEMVENVLKTSGVDTLIPVHQELQTAIAALQ